MNSDDRKPSEQETVFPYRPADDEAGMDDPRVVAALEEYLAALEERVPGGGPKLNRQAFLARHADIAGPLAECLDGLEALHRASSSVAGDEAEVEAASLPEEGLGGAPLGDFRLIREIGRGGMGIVYEAEQLSLGRRVALKVLSFAGALDGTRLQRFKNEAQAAAQLHHPHIVPVYYVGSERGVHFYAMQLIRGQNLAALVSSLRRDGKEGCKTQGPPSDASVLVSAPSPAPSADLPTVLEAQLSTQRSSHSSEYFRTVARLAAQAAEGLDYAHRMGIIHRDVKPANLLVDDSGNLWITDFGLAQFHADAGLTQTGDLLGTFRYMSPEQANGPRGVLDHRTDIYSLGATLYELLTLRPLFEGSDRQALLCQILSDEPPLPRSIDRSIPQELETIVLKALSKSPADRYATAQELADDLKRFLSYEPILARRATLVQRGRKWLRRHPSVMVAGIVLLVLLTASSLVSAALVRAEQEKTSLAYVKERQRADEAEKRFELAQRAADEMIQLANEELADKPGMDSVRKRLLELALSYYQELIEECGDQPEAQAELKDTRDRVKQIVADLAVLQGTGQFYLLRNADVKKDLLASVEQCERIDQRARQQDEQNKKSFHDFFRLTPEQKRQRDLERARDADRAIRAVLTPEQMARLRQIALQVRGLGAFQDLEVARELKLTLAQRERIRGIEAGLFLPPWGPPGLAKGGPGDRKGPKHHHRGPGPFGWAGKGITEQARKAAMDKALAVLNREQRARWQELTGKRFEGKVDFPGFGFPGFGFQGGLGRPGGPPPNSDRPRPR